MRKENEEVARMTQADTKLFNPLVLNVKTEKTVKIMRGLPLSVCSAQTMHLV